MDRDATYKKDTLDAVKKIEEYISRMSQEQFFDDSRTHDAAIRQLQIIGEASKRLSVEFKTSTTNAPWKKIAGTRDVLIHDYGEVDIDLVWKIIKDDLPALKSALE